MYFGEVYNKDVHLSEGFHLGMVNDQRRFTMFKKAFTDISVVDKVVCDLGAGTGMLSFEALRQGASHAYLVEINQTSLDALRHIVDKHPMKDRITIIEKDIVDLTIEDFDKNVEVIFSETFGGALYNEGFIVYMNHMCEMFPNSQTVPEKIVSYLTVSPVDFSNAKQWPQVGDPAIIEGYKSIYRGKRLQTDFPYDKSTCVGPALMWSKNACITQHLRKVTEDVKDHWVVLHHFVLYSPKVYGSWSGSAWYFDELKTGNLIAISLEDLVDPSLQIIDYMVP